MSSPTLTWDQYQQLPPGKRKRPLTASEYAALTRQQRTAAGLEDDEESAPADFNGPVFPNPDHLRPQLDTDPAVPVTRVPEGVTFQNQNFSGAPQMDVSNPAIADVFPAMGREIQTNMNTQPIKLPPGATLESSPDAMKLPPGAALEQSASSEPASDSGKHEPDWLDREIPLTDHWAATESGLQSVARGTRDAVKGSVDILRPPETVGEHIVAGLGGPIALPLYRTLRGLGHTASQSLQIAGAIHDINQSADPTGSYLKAAQETAGQGAGQALTALATEGAGRVLPKAVDVLTNPVTRTAPVRLAARTAEVALNQKLLPVRKLAKLNTPADAAEALDVKVPGRDYGLPKPATAAPPPQVDPALVTPARTLPGQVGKEVIRPRVVPAAPIPRRTGLALPPGPVSAADDLEGITSPQTESAGEVHEVEPPATSAAPVETPAAARAATSEPAAAATAAEPKATLTTLEKQINDALGGKPLKRGVPMKNQQRPLSDLNQLIKETLPPSNQPVRAPLTNLAQQIKSSAVPLPDDFTPTPESSLLKGYKYDPAAKEFHAVLNNGDRYTHGEVTPEQVEAFENADSQGSAWTKKIKQGAGTVLVKKNGAPVKPVGARSIVTDPETGKPEFSDVVAAKQSANTGAAKPAATAAQPAAEPAAGEDLTSLLQQSIDKVSAARVAKKAGSKAGSTIKRLVKGEAGQAGAPGSVTDADEGIADIQERPVIATKTGEVPARGFLHTVGADQNSILKTQRDLDSVFYHRQQIAKNGTPSVEVHVDEAGNVIGAQGRHRALAAVQQLGPDARVKVTIYKHPSPADQ